MGPDDVGLQPVWRDKRRRIVVRPSVHQVGLRKLHINQYFFSFLY